MHSEDETSGVQGGGQQFCLKDRFINTYLGMVALMVLVVILAFLLIFFCLMPYIKEITR